jgi:hypothetical protein
MSTFQFNPDPNAQEATDAQPSTAGPVTKQDADPDPNASGNPETAIQEELGDGAGIRGGYGDASQENGLEGGPNSAPDGSPGK